MDGFEDDVELNTQLDLALMNLADWFEPFNHSRVPACPGGKQASWSRSRPS
jgi:hypothetical protein